MSKVLKRGTAMLAVLMASVVFVTSAMELIDFRKLRRPARLW